MMDVKVKSARIGVASVEIDLGSGHSLIIRAQYERDRYRDVSVVWQLPSQPLGTVEEIRDRCQVSLVRTALDLKERETCDIKQARDLSKSGALQSMNDQETGYEAFSRIVFTGPGGILTGPSGEVEYCICGGRLADGPCACMHCPVCDELRDGCDRPDCAYGNEER